MNSAISLAFLLLGAISFSLPNPSRDKAPSKMRGVCWVGGDSIAEHNFNDLLANHVDWISQTPFGWQPNYDDPELHFGDESWYWGEGDNGIQHTAQLARQKQVKVILKPHIWLRRSNGKWRSDIEMNDEEEWDEWFCNYSDFILHYARLAEDSEIDMLCIGTELFHPATRFPARWRLLIRSIREVYSGQLTYAANFYQEYEQITWWDAVDYIGIQGYFPLCESNSPDLKQLKRGWQPHIQAMERVSKRFDKQVILTEIGYRNDPMAASKPWLWPNQIDQHAVQIDNALQADCYKAFFETCWEEDWLAGVFFWKWFHSTWKHMDYDTYLKERNRQRDSLAAIGQYRGNAQRRRVFFTPQGKEAEKVMQTYFREAKE